MGLRFNRNRRVAHDIEREAAYREFLARKAEEVKAGAEQFAPEGTGHYKRSLEVDGSRVLTTDVAGHLIEFGSKNNPPYAPLRRGATAAGLRLGESKR